MALSPSNAVAYRSGAGLGAKNSTATASAASVGEEGSSEESSGEEGSGSDDDDDNEIGGKGLKGVRGRRRAKGRGRLGVRTARVRSLIEDEEDDVFERAGRGL